MKFYLTFFILTIAQYIYCQNEISFMTTDTLLTRRYHDHSDLSLLINSQNKDIIEVHITGKTVFNILPLLSRFEKLEFIFMNFESGEIDLKLTCDDCFSNLLAIVVQNCSIYDVDTKFTNLPFLENLNLYECKYSNRKVKKRLKQIAHNSTSNTLEVSIQKKYFSKVKNKWIK